MAPLTMVIQLVLLTEFHLHPAPVVIMINPVIFPPLVVGAAGWDWLKGLT